MNNSIKIAVFTILFFSCSTVIAQKKKAKGKAKTQAVIKKKSPAKKANKKNTTKTSAVNEPQKPELLQLSKDTTTPNVVTITSAFKPFLRTAAKMNFTASAPELDTSRFQLSYNIPAQNLLFSYQPVPIKPLALTLDSTFEWQNHQYVKVGFGNFTTPYFETGLSFGHPTTAQYTVNGKFVTSKGSLDFQEFTKANINLQGVFGSIPNHNLVAGIGYQLSNQFKYGIKPGNIFTKDQLQQNFNTVDASIGLHTKDDNSYGLSYHPQLKASLFFDNNTGKETDIVAEIPFAKTVSSTIKLNVLIKADITNYNNNTLLEKISNNVYSVSPCVAYKSNDLSINIGISPTWNNNEFTLFPNILGEYHLSSNRLVALAGYSGFFSKNTYKSLASFNPFIEQPSSLINTKTSEIYAGIKGGFGKHFTFTSKVSFTNYTNQALFVNDAIDSKSQNFNVLYEPNLKALIICGELGYSVKENFSFLTSVKYTQFTSQQSLPKAYGILPLEINTTARYKILKDLYLKGDIYFWNGSYYRVQTIQTDKLSAAFDCNLGAEYKVLKKLNVYLDFNNLFNNQYQRWNQYNVFGFNVVGGVVYSFH